MEYVVEVKRSQTAHYKIEASSPEDAILKIQYGSAPLTPYFVDDPDEDFGDALVQCPECNAQGAIAVDGNTVECEYCYGDGYL